MPGSEAQQFVSQHVAVKCCKVDTCFSHLGGSLEGRITTTPTGSNDRRWLNEAEKSDG